MRTFLFFLFFIILISCNKDKVPDWSSYSEQYWYIDNINVPFKGAVLEMTNKENCKFKYTFAMSDSTVYCSNIPPYINAYKTVLYFSFLSDSITYLNMNQSINIDTTCFIAWNYNPKTNSCSNKVYFKSAKFSIVKRNDNFLPQEIIFRGETQDNRTVVFRTSVRVSIHQRFFHENKYGYVLYNHQKYLFDSKYYDSTNMQTGKQYEIEFGGIDYDNYLISSLHLYIYDKSFSNSINGIYNIGDTTKILNGEFYIRRFYNPDTVLTHIYLYGGKINVKQIYPYSKYYIFNLTLYNNDGDTIVAYWNDLP